MAAPRTRADAVRNYERVVAAAAEVLAEKGAEAGIPEIAARAGVGKGTVYRCFETKEHLIAAVVAERVRWFAEASRRGRRAPGRVGGVRRAAGATPPSGRRRTACSPRGSRTAPSLPEVVEAKARMLAAHGRA